MSVKNLFFQATVAASNAITINRERPLDKLDILEIKPISDGPVRKPMRPPVVTMAKPSTVLVPGILAAALNNTGTMHEEPTPITI